MFGEREASPRHHQFHAFNGIEVRVSGDLKVLRAGIAADRAALWADEPVAVVAARSLLSAGGP